MVAPLSCTTVLGENAAPLTVNVGVTLFQATEVGLRVFRTGTG